MIAEDIQKYVWKEKRLTNDRNEKQMEYKMVDLDENSLNTIYNHCKHMLYNVDPKNLGRMVVLDKIEEQLDSCRAELACRYFKSLKDSEGNDVYTSQNLYTTLKDYLNAIPDYNPDNVYLLGDILKVPNELKNTKMSYLLLAAKDQLGIFDHSKLTYSFIYKLGIFFTPSELQELENWNDNKNSLRLKIEDLKLQLGISNVDIRSNPHGLSAKQLTDMVHLKKFKNYRSCKYSQLSTSQLETLVKKVLYEFQDTVIKQITGWRTLMTQIEEVAKYKNYSLS